MTRATDKPTQRVLALLEILRKRIEEYPEVDEFFFDFEELRGLNPIFSTVNLVENIASDLSDRTNDAVIYKKLKTGKAVNELPHGVIAGSKATFSFIINDPEKLTISEEQKRPNKDNKIYKMEIAEIENDEHILVFLNEDYKSEHLYPNKRGEYWSHLLKVAEHGQTERSDARRIVDYFNTNKNNIIYKNTDYHLTKILSRDGERIFPAIDISMITDKALKQRRAKST